MSETIKVGDVVRWADVPDRALVRALPPSRSVYVRHARNRGTRVADPWGKWRDPITLSWILLAPINPVRTGAERVTIVALNLTGQESADDLRRLAEVFEVREAIEADEYLWCVVHEMTLRLGSAVIGSERLHAAGWRPGMTAEDAARLLAEK